MFIEQTPSDNSQKLKMKRESLGLSPGDVFKKIRIRTRYIEAIENSEFDELPDPVYTKNFIKTYARFLNIDENPVLQDYDAYLNAHREEQTPPPEPPPETKSFFSSFAATKNYWGILIVLIIFISIWLILKQNQSVPEDINTPTAASSVPDTTPPAAPALTDSQAPAIVPAPKTGVTDNPPATTDAKKSVLLITAGQETWLRIKPDNSPPVQLLLKPGEKFESSEEFFNLDIGNAGGIKIQYKGRSIENLGKPGEVIHIRLPQVKQ